MYIDKCIQKKKHTNKETRKRKREKKHKNINKKEVTAKHRMTRNKQ